MIAKLASCSVGALLVSSCATYHGATPDYDFYEQFNLSGRTQQAAKTYIACTNEGVGGLFVERSSIRPSVLAMIADRRAECSGPRDAFQRNLRRDHHSNADEVFVEFEQAVDRWILYRVGSYD